MIELKCIIKSITNTLNSHVALRNFTITSNFHALWIELGIKSEGKDKAIKLLYMVKIIVMIFHLF